MWNLTIWVEHERGVVPRLRPKRAGLDAGAVEGVDVVGAREALCSERWRSSGVQKQERAYNGKALGPVPA